MGMGRERLCVCIILYVKGADRRQCGKGNTFVPRVDRSAQAYPELC